MADTDGNGIPELAFLGFHPNLRGGRQVAYAVEVRDAMSARMIARIDKRGWSVPRDLDIQPDSNGNGEPEVAVLVDHLQGRRADSIQIDDLQGGADLPDIWLGQDWLVLRQERIGDINGNGSDDVAVLRVRSAQSVNVQIRDTMTNEWLSFVGFSGNYPPQRLVSIPDTNGNGASELVMFGSRFDAQDQQAVVKDSRTGATLSQVFFDINFPGQSFAACGDLNGNGAHDLALLGERTGDQRRRVAIRDGRTGAPVADVWF
jgi:hypothetical protein